MENPCPKLLEIIDFVKKELPKNVEPTPETYYLFYIIQVIEEECRQ